MGLSDKLFDDVGLVETIRRPLVPVLGSKLTKQDGAALTQLAQSLSSAMLASNLQATVRFMHPGMVSAMGGRANLLEVMRSEQAKNDAAGVWVESYNWTLTDRVFESKRSLVTFIRTEAVYRTSTDRVRYRSFLVAFSPDRDGKWFMLEGTKLNLPQFRQLFPGLPEQLQLPLVEKAPLL